MSLEPLKIPQNVYIEDRIIGPITLRQIILMGIGGGISYMIWGIFSQANGGATPLPLTIVSAIPFLIFAAFAFVKINDLSLMRIGLLMLENMSKPRTRILAPRTGFSIHIRTFTEIPKTPTPVSAEKQESYRRIDDLTAILDTPLRHATGVAPEVPEADEQEINVRDLSVDTSTQRLPVNRDRIKANPLSSESADGQRASVSIFHDIVAK
jgi:hypothetical protein